MEEQRAEEEEQTVFHPYVAQEPSPIPVCRCLRSDESSEKPPINLRKQWIYSTLTRTQAYLKDRHIPELFSYLMTKLLADLPDNPVDYLDELLSSCMLFRAGLGLPPVLYERRHFEAVVKSFDPGNRGWLSRNQIRIAFVTLGLTPIEPLEDNTPTEVVINELMKTQEKELFHLLSDGTDLGSKESSSVASSKSSPTPVSLVEIKESFSFL